MLPPQQRKQLSKFMSLILRHQPEKHGITLDQEGFIAISTLLASIQNTRGWGHVTEEMIREVVQLCEKQRYEMKDDLIRARYGHSIAPTLTYPEIEPPEVLYHGTSPEAIDSIRKEGLKPMRRQYVHHSTYIEQAKSVGSRHSRTPIILTIRAKDAFNAGVKFYQPEERLFISETIPPQFIEFPKQEGILISECGSRIVE